MIYVGHHEESPKKLKEKKDSFIPTNKEEATSSWRSFTGKEELSLNLNYIQKGLCAYCEISLDSSLGNHIEHIKPKSIHPNLTFQYENLVLSCISSENINPNDPTLSCGHYKKSNYDNNLFISPTDPNCSTFFSCNLFGQIEPSLGLSESEKQKVFYTIEVLNLNSLRLVRQRETIINEGFEIISELQNDKESLKYFLELEFEEVNGKYSFPFINIRKEHFEGFFN